MYGSGEYDALNRDIYEFKENLDIMINETGKKYTALESDLQLQNERLSYQNRLVASLSHNLKSPIITAKHLIEKEDIASKENISNKLDNLVSEINDISSIVYEDNSSEILKKTTFDLIELLQEISEVYEFQFKEKAFVLEMDIDEHVRINDYKLQYKQLIHNAYSNICNYALDNAYVKISCYVENNTLILSFYNDATKLTQEQIDNIFKLFYRVSDSKEGSGTGLYTVKAIASKLNGTIDFDNYDDGVILVFKKGGAKIEK